VDENTKQQIQDSGDLRKYRIELPNLYDDADLDPYEFRLLAHYKRVGACYESTRATAEKCKMSVGKVSAARDSLHEKGFIVIDEYVSKYDTLQITVTDVWAENFAKYAKMKADRIARSHSEQHRSHSEQHRSPHETKKELIEERTKEEASAVSDGNKPTKNNPYHTWEACGMALNPFIAEQLGERIDLYSEAWVSEAIRRATTANKKSLGYIDGILRNWSAKGAMDTPAEVKAPAVIEMPEYQRNITWVT
jgi:DnaD/phage-associated family protein